jgi:hypothetical protein
MSRLCRVSICVETAMCMLEMSGVGVGMGVHVVGGVMWVWWASCYGNCEWHGRWCCRHVPVSASWAMTIEVESK